LIIVKAADNEMCASVHDNKDNDINSNMRVTSFQLAQQRSTCKVTFNLTYTYSITIT